jgi:hypothetical protein
MTGKQSKKQITSITLPTEVRDRIDVYQEKHYFSTLNQAILRLILLGLEVDAKPVFRPEL